MYVPYRQQYPVCIIKLYVHSSAVETKTNQRYFTYCNSVLPVMQAENEGGQHAGIAKEKCDGEINVDN
jgi:hypothetical protein